jgi:hypothetical protein
MFVTLDTDQISGSTLPFFTSSQLMNDFYRCLTDGKIRF